MDPKLAVCNIFPDLSRLKNFARDNGFSGIDWSFDLSALPETPAEESRWVQSLSTLSPLEIRFHCPFYQVDLGHHNPAEARKATGIFSRIIHLVSKTGGKYLTIHIGLGHLPPKRLADFEDRLDLLRSAGCGWWAIEVKEPKGLLKTKAFIDRYLARASHPTMRGISTAYRSAHMQSHREKALAER